MDNFLVAASEWRADALGHQDNATWLYLCGYGIELNSAERLFLFEDFGMGPGAFLRNSVSVNNIVNGMTAMRGESVIARTQWYFLDMDRLPPRDLNDLQSRDSTAVFDTELPKADTREVAIYSASQPDLPAFTLEKDDPETLFSGALLECLNGSEAAVREKGRWAVTSTSLQRGLEEVLNRRASQYHVLQRVVVSGSVRGGTLCYLRHDPLVKFTVVVGPPRATEICKIEIRDSSGELVETFEPPLLETHANLAPGIYAITLVDVAFPERGMSQLHVLFPPAASLYLEASFPLRDKVQ